MNSYRQFPERADMKYVFSFGPFRLYPGKRILRKNGAIVSLGVVLSTCWLRWLSKMEKS